MTHISQLFSNLLCRDDLNDDFKKIILQIEKEIIEDDKDRDDSADLEEE